MVDVELVRGIIHLSVSLKLELREYCENCKALLVRRTELAAVNNLLNEAGLDKFAILQLALIEARSNYKKAKEACRTDRQWFISELTGVLGESYWKQIKGMLREQCSLDDPMEAKLRDLLIQTSHKYKTSSHAIECFDQSFIELLKNSINAIRKQYLAHLSDNTTLQMDIVLTIEGRNIIVDIFDNAGGFPDSYKKKFDNNIKSKSYKYELPVDEKGHHDEFSLGGEGRGMNMLCNFILDGEYLVKPGVSEKYYRDPKGVTGINIANTTKGAQITVFSPITPFEIYRRESVSDDSGMDSPNSAPPCGRDGNLSFFLTPLVLTMPSPNMRKRNLLRTKSSPLAPPPKESVHVDEELGDSLKQARV